MTELEPLSILSDHRRTLTNLFRDDIKDVNFYEAKKGAILGNHYHKKTKEYFYILKGACIVTSGDKREPKMRGDLFVVHPGFRHQIECLSNLDFMTFLTEAYDANDPDICK